MTTAARLAMPPGRSGRGVATTAILLTAALAAARVAAQSPTTQSATTVPTTTTTTSAPASGDIDDISLLELEVPMVVTPTRREQQITNLPYAISVITREDIRRSGARNVPEALRLVAGVDVAALHFGTYAVSPRGFHSMLASKTLVLVDGRQIFDMIFGGTVWATWALQMEDIERIEVIRGPGSVTWGANAVNGVINIITRDPRDQKGLTVIGGGGSRGWQREYVGYSFSDDRLALRVSGEYQGSDGFLRGGAWLSSPQNDFKRGSVAVYGTYRSSEHNTFTFTAGSSVLDGGYTPNPLLDPRRGNSGGQTNYLLGKWRHRIEPDNTLELTAYVNDFQASFGFDTIDYRYQQFALQLGHTFKPAASHTLTWGIDTRLDLLDGTNSDPPAMLKAYLTAGTIGAYVQDVWQLTDRWLLDLGARIDYETYGGFEPSARAALSYRLADHSTLYGAVSRAFQMPPPSGRFASVSILGGLGSVRGNRDLDAQTLLAYELGYRGRYFNRLDLNLNLFWNEHHDVLTYSPRLVPPGLVRLDYDNNGAASSYGVELGARYMVNKKLSLLGNYTYQQMRWRSSAPYHETDAISPPAHKFMLGARYSPTPDLHLSSHLYWVDATRSPNTDFPLVSRAVPPYFRLDLKAEYEFWNDRAAISAGVRNLLDSHHPEGTSMFLNDAEVPRMIFAELRISF